MTDAAARAPVRPDAQDMTGRLAGGTPPWEPATVPQPAIRPAPAGAGPQPGPSFAPQGATLPVPAGRRSARRRGGWLTVLPYLAVLAGAGTGLWWASLSAHRVRGGTLAVAGALIVAALARLVLPEKWAGMLASRKRLTDVATLVALACGLLAAGLVLPTSS